MIGASLSLTYARHWYVFNDMPRDMANQIRKGNEIDSAPRLLLNSEVFYGNPKLHIKKIALEFIHMGDYYTDPANAHTYSGHTLFNLRLEFNLWKKIDGFIHILNLTNIYYADRADFAFNRERYFPGQPRAFYLGLRSNF